MTTDENTPQPAPEVETGTAQPETADTSAAAGADSRVADLERQLAEKDQAYVELEGQMRRLAADFENYRRRQNQERENLIKFAGERILESFLDVVDNFERALQAGANATDAKQVQMGVEMIHRQVQDFLAKQGVVAIQSQGQPFDPNQHEAVVQQDASDVPDHTVLEEFRKGYSLNGRVIRHAMVKVANNPAMPQGSTPTPATDPAASQPTTDAPAETDSARP